MNTAITRFLRESGLKLLAVAELDSVDYSIVLYLLNSAMSGLESLIANETELASIIGHDVPDVRSSIERLTERGIIKSVYGDGTQKPSLQSVRLCLNWDVAKWRVAPNFVPVGASAQDAVIFPFRRAGTPILQILQGNRFDDFQKDDIERPLIHKPSSDVESSQRIFESFCRGRELDSRETKITQEVSKSLIEAHPVDQILLIIRHFGSRIPTLSLLASNWDHYVEQYEHESQKLDLFEVRQRQNSLDQRAREAALGLYQRRSELSLSEEEVMVLKLLSEHRHPRRQLFWAYQQRIRYPKLLSFFQEHLTLMLPITQGGQVVRGPDPD